VLFKIADYTYSGTRVDPQSVIVSTAPKVRCSVSMYSDVTFQKNLLPKIHILTFISSCLYLFAKAHVVIQRRVNFISRVI